MRHIALAGRMQRLLVVDELGPIFGKQTKRGHDGNGQDIVIVDGIEIGKFHLSDADAHVKNVTSTDGTIYKHPDIAAK